MNFLMLLVTGTLALGITTVGASAEDAAGRTHFLRIISVIEDVSTTTGEIGKIRHVSDVQLVSLDGIFARKYRRALAGALIAQQGTAQVDALRAAILENRLLTAELRKQGLDHRNIVAIDISASGRITVYTFGASA
jgi:hypothetical protein